MSSSKGTHKAPCSPEATIRHTTSSGQAASECAQEVARPLARMVVHESYTIAYIAVSGVGALHGVD
jgi:hypothetical protein